MLPSNTQPRIRAARCQCSAPVSLRGPPCPHLQLVPKASVREYLTEAVQHVFQTDDDKKLQWKASSFQGRISHDDHARLRKIYDVVKKSKEAAGDKPLLALPAPAEETVTLRKYLQGAIEKVFNTKDSTSNEPTWFLTPFSGRISSQREIERMWHVEQVIKDTMQKADKR
eukprot:jgi/Ulvmu1/4053/UM019_0030.1